MIEVINSFKDAMRRHGITPPDVIEGDGVLHRFKSDPGAKDDAGYYTLYMDGIPAGSFGCFRRDIKEKWVANGEYYSITDADRIAHAKEVEARRAKRAIEKKEKELKAQSTCQKLFNAASEDTKDHPYLVSKGVGGYGIKQLGRDLLIPMRDEHGVIYSLQKISPDGFKKFEQHGRIEGCYHQIGEGGDILICEGYATGASLFLATAQTVVVAFNVGNLEKVAKVIKEKYPNSKITICADDDYKTQGNPGLTRGTKVAAQLGLYLAWPHFDREVEPTQSDFNDLHKLRGLEAVREQVLAADIIEPPEPIKKTSFSWGYDHSLDADTPLESPPAAPSNIPGVLGEYVDYYMATAKKPQLTFALQSALALGAVALGRVWRTVYGNFTALYLVNIGPTGCGKDYSKACIDKVMAEASLHHMVNGAGYTSAGAVISSLLLQPNHLTIIDEFGMIMKQMRAHGNFTGASVVPVLLEAWTRCDGSISPQTYSSMSLTNEQRKAHAERQVNNPSLSLLCMATPDNFFDALSSKDMASGMLNRFLIAETDVTGYVPTQYVKDTPVPASVVNWVKFARSHQPALNTENAALKPETKIVDFSSELVEAFPKFEKEEFDKGERYKDLGLNEMFVRTHEMALRIALIVALSRNIHDPYIQMDDFLWAKNYVAYHFDRLMEKIPNNMAESKFDERCQDLIKVLKKHDGEMTRSQMSNSFFGRKYTPRERDEVIKSLEDAGKIVVDIQESSGGRPTIIVRLV